MRKFTLLLFLPMFSGLLWAQPTTADSGKKSPWREASLSLWGGYTVYNYSKNKQDLEDTCNTVKTNTGNSDINCTNRIGGIAGGLDLWAGNFAQFGVGVQYLQITRIAYDYTTQITKVVAGPPPSTVTEDVKTEFELTAQYIPVMAQFRINPKFFFIGVGVGYAFNVGTVSLKVGDQSQSSVRDDTGGGLIVQAMAGVSFPLGAVSIEGGARGSMITAYYESTSDAAGTTTYKSTSAYFVTPYAAVTMNF